MMRPYPEGYARQAAWMEGMMKLPKLENFMAVRIALEPDPRNALERYPHEVVEDDGEHVIVVFDDHSSACWEEGETHPIIISLELSATNALFEEYGVRRGRVMQ